MNPRDEQNLESMIQRATRDLPARPAPSGLERRVQAEIARRAALPWWRKSFVHWPLAARAGFGTVGVAVVALVLAGSGWLKIGFEIARMRTVFAPELQWLHAGSALINTLGDAGGTVLRNISPVWLYGGAAVVVGLYLALFGIGAAAYRTLYASR